MDVLSEDQALQAVLGRDLGIDNEALDFQQLEDFITNGEMCLPEEAIQAVAYGTGRPDQSGMSDLKLNVRLTSHLNPQPQTTHAQSMYCSVPNTRVNFDPTQHHVYKHHTSLPDSPPDSGSEPYSPPDGNQHNMQDPKPHSMVPVTTIPGPMYPQHRTHIQMPGKGPPPGPPPGHLPGYMHEPPKLNHLPQTQPPPTPHPHPHQMTPPHSHQILNPHFGSISNLQGQPTKKRKYPDSPNNTMMTNMLNGMNSIVSIKQEPAGLDPPDLFMRNSCPLPGQSPFPGYAVPDCSGDDDYSYDIDGSFTDSTYQVIKWQPYNQQKYSVLTDGELKDIPTPSYRVDADKGFNFSVPDDAFVCQKKNHFQVTVHIGSLADTKYVRTTEGVKKIESFHLHFHGIKMESASQVIKIEQSQSDRSKKSFYPVKVDVHSDQVTKVTVGRLHFSETTSNNMRKKGKPNPDQRYFMLVVALQAHSGDNSYLVAASSSERIIVRHFSLQASNPGQFDSDVDVLWSKGHTQDSVFHVGRVGVNTDHPDEAMTVHGNLKLTGHLMSPSDIRAKENLQEVNTKEALQKVQQLRLYKYQYSQDYAESAGIEDNQRTDTGVIAQEMMEVLPDAVQETGDVILPNGQRIENFLVVRKDRLFMENVGAVKELCKLTDNLENRIDELEVMNKKLAKLKRFDSLKSNMSLKSVSSVSTVSSSAPPKKSHSYHHGNSKPGHKHSRHQVPPPSRVKSLCSNRFIQITIIILILIMAFCLVAITTLYILERRNTQELSKGSSVVAASQGTTLPKINTTALPMMTSTTLPPRRDHTTPKLRPEPPTTTVPHSVTTMTIPAYPVCTECEPRCCSPPQEDEPNPHQHKNPVPHSNVVTQKTTPHYNTFTIDIPNESQNTPIVINNDGYHVINNDDNNIHHYYRKKRNTVPEDLLRPQIVIKQLNFTIGPEYCRVQGACEGRNNSYLAKVSRFFGSMPVTIQFKTDRPVLVAFCNDSFTPSCLEASSGRVSDKGYKLTSTNAEFDLTIGLHYTSTYKFRISPDNNLNICSLTANNPDVYEYNLTFKRQLCAENQES
ncbi:myelin regulatory factor-like isoform X1 [Haliotis rufescens]|uniref:myelin regulatory factor-like isoform X1 n=1 Tax=Haliotis rufescens TaxID=6454 RepID=UPI00201E903E|nr:myelin regulatory factor-like isoform X1 [Haliotis rufescens]